MNGAEAILKTLAENEVEACFANPGTSEMQMVSAFDRETRVRPVLCLFEGVVAGALFSFIQSFENLELSLLLVGPGRSTLPVEMLNYLEFRIDPTLAAVATIQIVLIGALMLITDRYVNLSRVVS